MKNDVYVMVILSLLSKIFYFVAISKEKKIDFSKNSTKVSHHSHSAVNWIVLPIFIVLL